MVSLGVCVLLNCQNFISVAVMTQFVYATLISPACVDKQRLIVVKDQNSQPQ